MDKVTKAEATRRAQAGETIAVLYNRANIEEFYAANTEEEAEAAYKLASVYGTTPLDWSTGEYLD